MSEQYKYVTLINSLPACEALFSAKQTPLSRIQLEKRLLLLEGDDKRDIEILGEILDWFRHALGSSDAELIQKIQRRIPQIQSESIKHYVEWRLEFRTLIAALRKKQLGVELVEGEAWGWGRWVKPIENHWHEPTFGLEKIMPWLSEVKYLLESEKPVELEKFILNFVWQWLERESFGHEFDLEAVAIYRMRWDLLLRYTSYAKEPAEARFNELLSTAIA